MWQNFSSIYTKSFGGKIWKNLHSGCPGNNFGKKINGASLENFLIKKNIFKEYKLKFKPAKESIPQLVQKNWKEPQFNAGFHKRHKYNHKYKKRNPLFLLMLSSLEMNTK